MRYGLCLANFGTYGDPRTVVQVGEEAEAAGWEALLIWDHLSFVWQPRSMAIGMSFARQASRPIPRP